MTVVAETTSAGTSAAETLAETAAGVEQGDAVEQDLLVEDVSIDGMCGVY